MYSDQGRINYGKEKIQELKSLIGIKVNKIEDKGPRIRDESKWVNFKPIVDNYHAHNDPYKFRVHRMDITMN